MTNESPARQPSIAEDWWVARAIDNHTMDGAFNLSHGGTAKRYVDLRSALLCTSCGRMLVDWYSDQINGYIPVATGSFGALLLGHLNERGIDGVLWNPKGHGITWSGAKLDAGTEVVIVDDVLTTGSTLRALRAACEAQEWTVVAEIVAHRPLDGGNNND